MTITQESSTPPTEADPRVDLIDGLRAVANFYEQHPDFPLPATASVDIAGDGTLELKVVEWRDAEAYAALVEQLGGQRRKVERDYSDNGGASYLDTVRSFSPRVDIAVTTYRETVCERVQVGTETVHRQVLPEPVAAQIEGLRETHLTTVTEEVPRFEWRCSPVLNARARGLAGVASLRDAAADARAETIR